MQPMHALHFEQIGRFVLFPVSHHTYEFAIAARQAFLQVRPCAVALEYPALLEPLILQGLKRLPRISVVVYGQPTKYIRIEPVDAFVEAGRIALEHDVPVRCIDSSADYPDVYEPLPDAYAMTRIGHAAFCKMILEKGMRVRVDQDSLREAAMSYHLQDLAERIPGKKPILVLCGLSHLQGLKDQLQRPHGQPFEKPLRARIFHLSPKSLGEIMGQFPFLTSVYEMQRNGTAVEAEKVTAPDFSEGSIKLRLVAGQKPESIQAYADKAQANVYCGASADRNDLLSRFLYECRRYYEVEIGDEISPQAFLLLTRFARKYATIKGMLLPDFYELLIASRSCVSSHFCYRVWEIGTYYAPQLGPAEIETIELRADEVFAFVSKVRMNPHAPLKPRATLPRFLKRKEKRSQAGKDRKFSPFTICSYQPEDLVIENYGNYLRTKGKSMLSEERKKVRPFETSLLDGIDLRETIRNWHTGQIFVQECSTVRGEVSSLVVIFDEDGLKYPYTMTWLGEHYQESDMAFYATDPEEREVGPGIRKSVYGGFLMTMPPGRLFDVFADPAYQGSFTQAERLLLAAIDYSLEKYVLYAAAKPPRPVFQTIAGRYGRRILYIPLAQLSPVMLQKIRSFHILSDKSVRDYAKDHIW